MPRRQVIVPRSSRPLGRRSHRITSRPGRFRFVSWFWREGRRPTVIADRQWPGVDWKRKLRAIGRCKSRFSSRARKVFSKVGVGQITFLHCAGGGSFSWQSWYRPSSLPAMLRYTFGVFATADSSQLLSPVQKRTKSHSVTGGRKQAAR